MKTKASSFFNRRIVPAIFSMILTVSLSGQGSYCIFGAIDQSDLGQVKKIVAADSQKLYVQNKVGEFPLHHAVVKGDREIVGYILSQKVPVDQEDREKTTPLQIAANTGNEELFGMFVKMGADIHHIDDNGMNTLMWAARGGNEKIFQYLVGKKADMKLKTKTGLTVLHMASLGGKTSLVKNLLDNGADVNGLSSDQQSPLILACYKKQNETAGILVKGGADVNIADKWDNTPLSLAIMNNDSGLFELLAEHGADLQDGHHGQSALHAAAYSGSVQIAGYLLDRGWDVNLRDSEGNTAVFGSIWTDNMDFVRLMVEKGADVNLPNNAGFSALHTAVKKGKVEMVKLFLGHGGDVALKDKHYGRTPLHWASIAGHGEIVRILLDAGASPDSKDLKDKTPGYYAAYYNHPCAMASLNAKGMCEGASDLTSDAPVAGEARLWYLGHSGWAVLTASHLLIFDYWTGDPFSGKPSLANGHIDPEEIAGKNVVVFVSHEHRDHFDTTIFNWAGKARQINYVYGFEPSAIAQYKKTPYNGPGFTFVPAHETRNIAGIEVTPITSTDAGQGFFVNADGVGIYHPGDHANKERDLSGAFPKEIDFLASKGFQADVAFTPVRGCGFPDEEAVKIGTGYMIGKMKPGFVIPMHSVGEEYRYETFAKEIKQKNPDVRFICPENKGDRYYLKNNTISAL